MKYSILHIIYSLFRGGAERLIETTVRFSDPAAFKHTVCSLTGTGDIAGSIEKAGGRVHTMNKRGKFDLSFLIRLTRLVSRGGFDLLHLHNMPGNLWGTAAKVISGSGAPMVRTEHGYLIHRRYPGAYKYLYKPLSRRSRRIICVCEDLRRTLSSSFPSLSDRFITIRNGIPVEEFSNLPERPECRRIFGLPENARIIGTAGRLSPEKNQIELLKAFSRIARDENGIKLAIMGSGEMKRELASAVSEFGLSDRVFLLEETGSIGNFYGALDIFALSSRSEGLPLTLLESMACGLPVVAPAVGGIPEVIEDRLSGFMYPSGRDDLLAEKILNIISDPGRSGRMGMRGMKIVNQNFSAGRFASEQDRLYRKVIKESGAG